MVIFLTSLNLFKYLINGQSSFANLFPSKMEVNEKKANEYLFLGKI